MNVHRNAAKLNCFDVEQRSNPCLVAFCITPHPSIISSCVGLMTCTRAPMYTLRPSSPLACPDNEESANESEEGEHGDNSRVDGRMDRGISDSCYNHIFEHSSSPAPSGMIVELTWHEKMSVEGENIQPKKQSNDTEMTSVLHTDTGTTTASEPAEPGKVSMSEEGRCVSKLPETNVGILPTNGSFCNIVELSMDMIAQGSEGERSTSGDQTKSATRPTGDEARAQLLEEADSQGRYCDCAYSAKARQECKEHAADRDSFRRTHCALSARAVGYTLHSAPSLRHTTSNCSTATSNCSTAKDPVALVDAVSCFSIYI